jgi:hypothetical protein
MNERNVTTPSRNADFAYDEFSGGGLIGLGSRVDP